MRRGSPRGRTKKPGTTAATRREYLGAAYGTDIKGAERRFAIYREGPDQFKIHNDKHHVHLSHSSRRVTNTDICAEVALVYEVVDVRFVDRMEGLRRSRESRIAPTTAEEK